MGRISLFVWFTGFTANAENPRNQERVLAEVKKSNKNKYIKELANFELLQN